MALLNAAEIPFAVAVHLHNCVEGVGNTQMRFLIEVYRCFLSAAARAVASSTISGRNGMPSNLPIDAPAVEFANLVYRSISRSTLWIQLFINQGGDAGAAGEEEQCWQ
jgi:hypothetical protein